MLHEAWSVRFRWVAVAVLGAMLGCSSTDKRPQDPEVAEPGEPVEEGGRIGQWEIDVSRANLGEGYAVVWYPTQTDEPLRIGIGKFGWLIDGTWTKPDNIDEICPQGTTVVQAILSWVHTWRPGLSPDTLASAQRLFPDRHNQVDEPKGPQPDGTKDPTYSGSAKLPGGAHKSTDAPGINAAGARLVDTLEGKLETCVVCKGTWRSLDCITWGFVADYTADPPAIEPKPEPPEFGPASEAFTQTLNDYLN